MEAATNPKFSSPAAGDSKSQYAYPFLGKVPKPRPHISTTSSAVTHAFFSFPPLKLIVERAKGYCKRLSLYIASQWLPNSWRRWPKTSPRWCATFISRNYVECRQSCLDPTTSPHAALERRLLRRLVCSPIGSANLDFRLRHRRVTLRACKSDHDT